MSPCSLLSQLYWWLHDDDCDDHNDVDLLYDDDDDVDVDVNDNYACGINFGS